jgi:hypothetical protein
MLVSFFHLPEVARLWAEEPVWPADATDYVVSQDALNSSVGMTGSGQFLVGWETERYGVYNLSDIELRRYLADGTPIAPVGNLADQITREGYHHAPSVAVSRQGKVRVGWWAQRRTEPGIISFAPILLWDDFDFGLFDLDPQASAVGNEDYYPSAGTSDADLAALAWTRVLNATVAEWGLLWTFDDYDNAHVMRECFWWLYEERAQQWRRSRWWSQ